jgi:hypothetical protein
LVIVIELVECSSRRDLLRQVGIGGIAAGLLISGVGLSARSAKAAEVPHVVLEWVGAWETDDAPRRIAALYGTDGTYGDVSANANVQGADIETFVQAFLAATNGVSRYFRQAFVDGDYTIVDQQITAMASDGFNFMFQVYALTLFKVEGTSITWSSDYYDSGSILMQLGAIPAAPWFNVPGVTDTVDRFCAKSG